MGVGLMCRPRLLSILADTTALNTGILAGIFRRLEIIFKRAFETDIITLECLFHIIELLLGKVIRCYDGETVSPTGLEEGAVQNRIETIFPSSLTETNLKSHETIYITPTQNVQDFLNGVLEWAQNKPASSKAIRDDQASMLVLACATYREIPSNGLSNMKRFLFYKQEKKSHARWMTTANGYLRLNKVFSIAEFNDEELSSLNSIVKFIVNVYVPSFLTFFCTQALFKD